MNVFQNSGLLSCTFATAIAFCLAYKLRWLLMSRYKERGLKAICSKLGIEQLWLHQGSDEEVKELKEKAARLKAGEVFWFQGHLRPVIKSSWQVTRVPYLIEWEHKDTLGDQETLIHFDNIGDFDDEDPVSLLDNMYPMTDGIGRQAQLKRVRGFVQRVPGSKT